MNMMIKDKVDGYNLLKYESTQLVILMMKFHDGKQLVNDGNYEMDKRIRVVLRPG